MCARRQKMLTRIDRDAVEWRPRARERRDREASSRSPRVATARDADDAASAAFASRRYVLYTSQRIVFNGRDRYVMRRAVYNISHLLTTRMVTRCLVRTKWVWCSTVCKYKSTGTLVQRYTKSVPCAADLRYYKFRQG